MFLFVQIYRKTALMLALCQFLRDKYSLAAVSIVKMISTRCNYLKNPKGKKVLEDTQFRQNK